MKDTFHDNKVVTAIAPATYSDGAFGPAIDLQGFDSVLFAVSVGALAAGGAFSLKIQESSTPNSGDFTNVDAADQLGEFPAALVANTAVRVGYIGSRRKRYVRLSLGKTAGTTIAASAVAIVGHPEIAPVA